MGAGATKLKTSRDKQQEPVQVQGNGFDPSYAIRKNLRTGNNWLLAYRNLKSTKANNFLIFPRKFSR